MATPDLDLDPPAADVDDPDATLPGPLLASGHRDATTVPAGTAPSKGPGSGSDVGARVSQDLVGMRLGAWTLLRKIGQGGMGEVWLADRSDGLFEAHAAIKLLRHDQPAEHMAARFARERAVLARLDHPSIARLLDAGVDQGRAYIVLEHVQGLPLIDHVRETCPDLASRVRLMIGVAEAVDHAHGRLVVHRDLKPANVLVLPDGAPKLLDFGVAGLLGDDDVVDGQLTHLTGRRLTLAYAAPEQLTGEAVGVAADVFSLGVMLFELCSGNSPFVGDLKNRAAAEHALLHDEAPRLTHTGSSGGRGNGNGGSTGGTMGAEPAASRSPPRPQDFERVRGDLEAVVAKALRKDPADRYSSVRLLIDDLQRWLTHRPVSVRRDDWRHRSRLWLRRHALLAGTGLALLLALSAGLGVSLWQWQRAERAARASDQVTAYLAQVLGSAQPQRHGGQVPTVFQLLENSRRDIGTRFADSPATQERLLAVLVDTYRDLNRSDLALPLAQERLALAERQHGPDADATLRARLSLAGVLSLLQRFDQVLLQVEPIRQDVRRRLGDLSDEHRDLLYLLTYAYTRLGRFDDAHRLLAEARRVTDSKHAPGSIERIMFFNRVQVLETSAGRLREGLAALQQTQPYWDRLAVEHAGEQHTLERNLIAVQIRLGDYQGLVERGNSLLARIDARLGPGSDQAMGLRAELARALIETGRFDEAWQQRRASIEGGSALAAREPGLALPERAFALHARVLAQPQAASELRSLARAMADETRRSAAELGLRTTSVWSTLFKTAVLLGDQALAGQSLQALRTDPGLARSKLLRSRINQLDGEWQRWQGDLARSRELLQERLADQLHMAETHTPPIWSAALDLVVTAIDQDDPGAAALLQQARTLRPRGMPADAPLDALQAWLDARLQAAGKDQRLEMDRRWAALARRVGREPSDLRESVLAAALL